MFFLIMTAIAERDEVILISVQLVGTLGLYQLKGTMTLTIIMVSFLFVSRRGSSGLFQGSGAGL